jgi:hypothetical protein
VTSRPFIKRAVVGRDKKGAAGVTHSTNGAALSSLCDRYQGVLG